MQPFALQVVGDSMPKETNVGIIVVEFPGNNREPKVEGQPEGVVVSAIVERDGKLFVELCGGDEGPIYKPLKV
jgi:hypothetical protein